MFVAHERVHGAARQVADAGGDVPATAVGGATNRGAEAIPSSRLAGALTDVGEQLQNGLTTFAQGCEVWSAAVEASLAEYVNTDAAARGRLDWMRPRAV